MLAVAKAGQFDVEPIMLEKELNDADQSLAEIEVNDENPDIEQGSNIGGSDSDLIQTGICTEKGLNDTDQSLTEKEVSTEAMGIEQGSNPDKIEIDFKSKGIMLEQDPDA